MRVKCLWLHASLPNWNRRVRLPPPAPSNTAPVLWTQTSRRCLCLRRGFLSLIDHTPCHACPCALVDIVYDHQHDMYTNGHGQSRKGHSGHQSQQTKSDHLDQAPSRAFDHKNDTKAIDTNTIAIKTVIFDQRSCSCSEGCNSSQYFDQPNRALWSWSGSYIT
jgi:hypothetical protein